MTTDTNNNNQLIPEAYRDIYLVTINNEAVDEYASLDLVFQAIFENDGSEHQRNDIKEKIRRKCK